jgi:hypothetical protein
MDLFFDVPPEAITPTGISLEYAEDGAYLASAQIGANEIQQFTMNAPWGFQNELANHTVYVMVDSATQIVEGNETNNLSAPLSVAGIPVPTPTPIPSGLSIEGVVSRLTHSWVPQAGVTMYLVFVEPSQGRETVIGTQQSAADGRYTFANVPLVSTDNYYKVVGCFTENSVVYVGTRSSLTPPNQFVNVFLFANSGNCPYN